MQQAGLLKAIQYFGSQSLLAKALGLTQQAVNHWLNREQRIPELAALKIFAHTQGIVALSDLVADPKDLQQLLHNAYFFHRFPRSAVPTQRIVYAPINSCCHQRKRAETPEALQADFSERPILIDTHHRLISCPCYLESQMARHSKSVYVHQIQLTDILACSPASREFLEYLTLSEKVMLGFALERELGKRQGMRNDLKLVDKSPQVEMGTKSRVWIAQKAGFKNDQSYRRVKSVVQLGDHALVAALDQQRCSIASAKQMLSLPYEAVIARLQSRQSKSASSTLSHFPMYFS